VLLLLCALTLAACARDPHLDATEYGVHVVDPGSVPGRVVRYEYPDGSWPRFHVGVEVTATWSAGDRSDQAAPLSRGRFPVSIRTRPVAGGAAVATVRIGKPVPAIDGCREFGGEMTLRPTGRVESMSLVVPEGTPAAARPVLEALLERISRLLLPLPETKIGVGARWKVVRPLAGVPGAVEILTCRLTRLRGDEARISMRLLRETRDLPREVPLRGSHGEVKAEHHSGGASGQATLLIDLRRFSLTGEEIVTTTEEYGVGDDGAHHQVVRTSVRARTSIAP